MLVLMSGGNRKKNTRYNEMGCIFVMEYIPLLIFSFQKGGTMRDRLKRIKMFTVAHRSGVIWTLGLTTGVITTIVVVRKTPTGLFCITQEQAKALMNDSNLVINFTEYSGNSLLERLFFSGKVAVHIHPEVIEALQAA
jgi:hypothetical protein